MIPFFLAGDIFIAFRGTAGGVAVSDQMGVLLFTILIFALGCIFVYAVLLAAFLEVLGNYISV